MSIENKWKNFCSSLPFFFFLIKFFSKTYCHNKHTHILWNGNHSIYSSMLGENSSCSWVWKSQCFPWLNSRYLASQKTKCIPMWILEAFKLKDSKALFYTVPPICCVMSSYMHLYIWFFWCLEATFILFFKKKSTFQTSDVNIHIFGKKIRKI